MALPSLVAFAVGCGGTDAPNVVSQFVGVWSGAGTISTQCTGESPVSEDVTLSISLTEVDEGHVQEVNAVGCKFEYSVTGDSATLSNGPVSCPINGAQVSYQAGGFTRTGVNALSGFKTGVDVLPTGVMCTFSEDFSFAR